MIFVPAGECRIGDIEGDRDETYVFTSRTSAFWIGKYEVSEDEYAAFLEANGRAREITGRDERMPATQVSWFDAIQYCNWRSAKEGLTPAYDLSGAEPKVDWQANGYRLPTEVEWEYAAAGGPLAGDFRFRIRRYAEEFGWFNMGVAEGKKPRGLKKPNNLGLYDTAGNVWEWCWDTYGQYPVEATQDYKGAEEGAYKSIRGGSWLYTISSVRPSNRNYTEPETRSDEIGFRLARTATESEAKAVLGAALVPTPPIELAPAPWDAPYRDPSVPLADRVEDLLARMSLQEKIGQMTQVCFDYLMAPESVRNYSIGSVIAGGDSRPASEGPESWALLADRYQREAAASRLGIPLLMGIDAVHGHAKVAGATVFPHNIGLGAANDPALMERIGKATAIEMLATGFRWSFAPCVAVARDERWGRTYESYSEDPEIASRLGAAFIRGLQGASIGNRSVAATAKHFLADGGTKDGMDRGDAVISEAELRAIHLPPYRAAVEAGVATVMASYSSWNGTKHHANKALLTGTLRDDLGFTGVLVSDWGAWKLLPGKPSEQVRAMINAGVDVCMVPDDFGERGFQGILKELVELGGVPMSRIDQAVRRILSLKFSLGLFETPYSQIKGLERSVGSTAHRAVAREAVRKSIVLLKNEDEALPLPQGGKIWVAGPLADDLRAQCGGWTLGWEGANSEVKGGTSVLKALRDAAAQSGAEIGYGPGLPPEGSSWDRAVLVIGEQPYAEFMGDRTDLRLRKDDRELVAKFAASGIQTVVVLISGRPMVATAEIEASDAFVAAWLPGSEGGGVADILFGLAKPSGKLPMSWPASNEQIPVNQGDGKAALYPLGYGLSY
jgi:beta-glucosidase